MHLQLAPIAKGVYTTSFSYHHSLPWSVVTGPEGMPEGCNNPCIFCGPTIMFFKDCMVINSANPNGQSRELTMPLGPGATSCPRVW